MQKEAEARIDINELLEESGWRFFKTPAGPPTIILEPSIKIEEIGDDSENVKKGDVDCLLTDNDGFSNKDPMIYKATMDILAAVFVI